MMDFLGFLASCLTLFIVTVCLVVLWWPLAVVFAVLVILAGIYEFAQKVKP